MRITEAIEREIEGDARLGSLARQIVPAVGDICVVHEATEGGAGCGAWAWRLPTSGSRS